MCKKYSWMMILIAAVVAVLSACGNASPNKRSVLVGTGENPVLLTYMAERFQERHPDIEIKIFYNGEWMGNENMAKLVAAGQMPDIIYVENPQFPLQNGWLVDLNQFVAKEESVDIPESFLRYCKVGDMLAMLPSQVFMNGIMVNLSLLDAENIPRPDYNWTIDEFLNIVRNGTRPGRIIGTNNSDDIFQHLPPQLNHDLGWGAFNSVTRQYQLKPEWLQAANIAAGMARSNLTLSDQLAAYGTFDGLEEGSSQRISVEDARRQALHRIVGEDVEEDWHSWVGGRAATWFDFSWGMNFDVGNPDIYTGFEWDFFPFPTGDRQTTSRPGIVIDSVGITTAAKYPDAAWEFLKWITFDLEGINARFDFVENWSREDAMKRWPGWPENQYPQTFGFTHMPPATHPGVIERWVELNDAPPGLLYMMGNMDIGYVDGFKVVPGEAQANGKTIRRVYLDEVRTGRRTASDIVDDVQTIANQIVAEAFASIGL